MTKKKLMEERMAKLLDLCRYQHLVLADIHGLTEDAKPSEWRDAIRLKAAEVLHAVGSSGLLS